MGALGARLVRAVEAEDCGGPRLGRGPVEGTRSDDGALGGVLRVDGRGAGGGINPDPPKLVELPRPVDGFGGGAMPFTRGAELGAEKVGGAAMLPAR